MPFVRPIALAAFKALLTHQKPLIRFAGTAFTPTVQSQTKEKQHLSAALLREGLHKDR